MCFVGQKSSDDQAGSICARFGHRNGRLDGVFGQGRVPRFVQLKCAERPFHPFYVQTRANDPRHVQPTCNRHVTDVQSETKGPFFRAKASMPTPHTALASIPNRAMALIVQRSTADRRRHGCPVQNFPDHARIAGRSKLDQAGITSDRARLALPRLIACNVPLRARIRAGTATAGAPTNLKPI